MRKRIIVALALVATLLVPSTALAAKKPAGITYTTTTFLPQGGQGTVLVENLHFEARDGQICAVFDVTVQGSFQYWTGSEFVTMTQDPATQRIANCRDAASARLDLAGNPSIQGDLNCAAGTFDTWRWTTSASDVRFVGSDGSYLIGGVQLAPLVLTANTAEEQKTICDLQARVYRLPDKRLAAELNDLLVLFSAT
jgi:hypothetical protein